MKVYEYCRTRSMQSECQNARIQWYGKHRHDYTEAVSVGLTTCGGFKVKKLFIYLDLAKLNLAYDAGHCLLEGSRRLKEGVLRT